MKSITCLMLTAVINAVKLESAIQACAQYTDPTYFNWLADGYDSISPDQMRKVLMQAVEETSGNVITEDFVEAMVQGMDAT